MLGLSSCGKIINFGLLFLRGKEEERDRERQREKNLLLVGSLLKFSQYQRLGQTET